MRYSLVAAALIGAVAASPAWAPPAYGGSEGESTTQATVVVTVTSCGAEVTNCPAASTPAQTYPATTPASTPYSPEQPPASTPDTAAPPADTPYSPVEPSSPAEAAPPADTPYSPVGGSAPAPPPFAPEQPSAPVSIPPPAETTPAAETPYSPVGGSAPPVYPSAPVESPASPLPVYPVPGNGTYSPSGTASGAPSASSGYPIEQTGNAAVGLKAGSFLAGCGAIAALLL